MRLDGSLKSAGKQQESATFLQRSFLMVAVQFFACCSAAFGKNGVRTAEKQVLQLQHNFSFRLWHVAGVGFRGVGFKTLVAHETAIGDTFAAIGPCSAIASREAT